MTKESKETSRTSRFSHVPNIVTASRMVLALVIAVLFLFGAGWVRWSAFGLFVIAVASDYVDGYLARHRGWDSALGRYLDPIADKILVIIGLFMLTTKGILSEGALFGAMLIVMREILITDLREFLVDSGIRLRTVVLAKWKTLFQFMSIGLLMLVDLITMPQSMIVLSYLLFWIAVVLTVISGWVYGVAGVKKYLDHKELSSS